MKKDRYRFDNAYGKIYELHNDVYLFIGSYIGFGIDKNMSYEEKERIVDDVCENENETDF